MPGSDVKGRLNLTHPDYVSDKVRQIGGELASKQGVTKWQMRDGSAVKTCTLSAIVIVLWQPAAKDPPAA
jgi:hypothetical protein